MAERDARSGHDLARADAPGPAGESGGAEIAGERPDGPAPALYTNGVADSALRRALARLRRRPDPAVRAVADQLAREAAAALLALAARADAADPVLQERRAAELRRAERLRVRLAGAEAQRERRAR